MLAARSRSSSPLLTEPNRKRNRQHATDNSMTDEDEDDETMSRMASLQAIQPRSPIVIPCQLPPHSRDTLTIAPTPSFQPTRDTSLTPIPLRPPSNRRITQSLPIVSQKFEDIENTRGADLRLNDNQASGDWGKNALNSMCGDGVPEASVDLGSSQSNNPLASHAARDALLVYAYRLYESPNNPFPSGISLAQFVLPGLMSQSKENVYRSQLLPLLSTLQTLHPQHLPTLLLLGCVYHALGEFQTSVRINEEILRIDEGYVEAMGNLGTTLKSLNRFSEARVWWMKALQRRPTYWDAVDNLVHLALVHKSDEDASPDSVQDDRDAHEELEAIDEAQAHFSGKLRVLKVYVDVLSRILDCEGRLLIPLPPDHLSHLQRTLNSVAVLRSETGGTGVPDLVLSIELAIRTPRQSSEDTTKPYTLRDLLLATFIVGSTLQQGSSLAASQREAQPILGGCLGPLATLFERQCNILQIVHDFHALTNDIPNANGHYTSVLLLHPEQVMRLPMLLFRDSLGILPGICLQQSDGRLECISESSRQATHHSTCVSLLYLAKYVQELSPDALLKIPGFPSDFGSSRSVLLLLYYLAMSLNPSAGICNNIGLALASLVPGAPTESTRRASIPREHELAQSFFEKGLQLEKTHPHLLTNLGSLLKDHGRVADAIRLYMVAIQANPDFDIALANLGNAFRDLGQPTDSILYYRRALAVRPNFPEAICGLASSMTSIGDWRGRGGFQGTIMLDEEGDIVLDQKRVRLDGWMTHMLDVSRRQLSDSYKANVGLIATVRDLHEWVNYVQCCAGITFTDQRRTQWLMSFSRFFHSSEERRDCLNEAGFIIRLTEKLERMIQRRWYISAYGKITTTRRMLAALHDESPGHDQYVRPTLPAALGTPQVPSVLPFHTFSCSELMARDVRLLTHRCGLRLSYGALVAPWRSSYVYPPPPPPTNGMINLGYVSSDFTNHPLAHLMQSVFGLHDSNKFRVHVYSTGFSDKPSSYREKIMAESHRYLDVSGWSTSDIIDQIKSDQIHILINLGGYTKDARNDIFAARPCPIQISMMGFAGTLGVGWCDYTVSDTTACPPDLVACERWRAIQRLKDSERDGDVVDFDASLDPEAPSQHWVYTEKIIYMPHTYLATDHKQTSRNDEGLSVVERAAIPDEVLWRDEAARRLALRQSIFPDIPEDTVILANFNQTYKICPTMFKLWVEILERVPNAILWLLRFPPQAEEHLRRTARRWGGEGVEKRLRFTDVVEKTQHILRARVADLFLDTTECSAHTVAADVLWSGTPIVTWPRHRYKTSSCVAASVAYATGFGEHMVSTSSEDYVERAVKLAQSLSFHNAKDEKSETKAPAKEGELLRLRRSLFLARDEMPLFDTARWVRNLERGFREAWRRWVEGIEFEGSEEWDALREEEKKSGCIWVADQSAEEIVMKRWKG